MRMFADLQRAVRELAAANPLATAGITTQPGGITVTGSETITGDLNVQGAGTVSGNLNVSGSVSATNGTYKAALDPSGLNTYDAHGNRVAGMSTNDGSVGTYGTGSYTGYSIIMNNGEASNVQPNVAVWTPGYNVPGYISIDTTNHALAISGPGNDSNTYATLELRPDASWTLQPAAGNNSIASAWASTDSSFNFGTASNRFYGFSTGQWSLGNGSRYVQDAGNAVQIVGGLSVSGTKNFIMDHPTKPGWTLKHASTESPHNGVEYWGSVTLDASGEAVVTLPEYFEALTSPENRNVQVTPIGRTTAQVSADRIASGTFTVYGAPGQEVDWLVKAVRVSTDASAPIDFDVEAVTELMPEPPAAPMATSTSTA